MTTVRRDLGAVSDLVGHGFEEEDYSVVDYVSHPVVLLLSKKL